MKRLSYLVIAGLVFFASCDENTIDFDAADSQNVENEAVTDAYFEDVDDISALTVSSDPATLNGGRESNSGRQIQVNDHRLNCPGIIVTLEVSTDSTPQHPKGVITINFGNGCEDARGNVRKGIIIITYNGRRFFPGSSVVTTFDGYEVNGIQIEGIRTLTNTSSSLQDNPKFNITVVGGKITWPDGTFATRYVDRTREWVRVANNPLNDQWLVTGTAAGINRHGVGYSMEITKPLVFKRSCAIDSRIILPVEGTKVFTTEDKQVIIDFGDGECDRLITVTVNGISREIEVRGNN